MTKTFLLGVGALRFGFRTNYKRTIEALESAFEKDQIFYGIYEELFTADKIKELSDFCCVPYKPDLTTEKFNVSPKADYEAETLREEIRKHYDYVYQFCYERFPQTKSLWTR